MTASVQCISNSSMLVAAPVQSQTCTVHILQNHTKLAAYYFKCTCDGVTQGLNTSLCDAGAAVDTPVLEVPSYAVDQQQQHNKKKSKDKRSKTAQT